jgi:transketolase
MIISSDSKRGDRSVSNAKQLANQIRLNVLEVTYRTGSGHLGACLSIADILAVLYSNVLHHNPSQPNWDERDYFILSKGHAALAEYSVLAQCGYFPITDLLQFKQNDSIFSGHPTTKIPGIEISTGSLGQGVGFAVGLALGLKHRNSSNRVFCLLGDGENDEGSIWEAVEFAGTQELNNLTLIIDHNGQKARTITENEPEFEKIYAGFKFRISIVNGHSHPQLQNALEEHYADTKPQCIIANTIKGQGVNFLENDPNNHNRTINLFEFQKAWKQLNGQPNDYIDPKAEYAR